MIPKIIWQTYETDYDSLPEYIKDYCDSWKYFHPNYEYNFFSSLDRDNFVLNEFGEKWYSLFNNLPVKVMKADIWRLMVLYENGGIYSDIDNLCKSNMDIFAKDYNLVFFTAPIDHMENEDDFHINTSILMSSPKNIIIKNLLDIIYEKIQTINYNDSNFVFNTTGPGLVSEYFYSIFNTNKKTMFNNEQNINNSLFAKQNKVRYYGKDSWKNFHSLVPEHAGASGNWKNGYISWIDEQRNVLNELNP